MSSGPVIPEWTRLGVRILTEPYNLTLVKILTNICITKFKMALAQTKLDKSDDSQVTIVFFKATLPPQ